MDDSTKKLLEAYLSKSDAKLKAARELLDRDDYYDDVVSRCYYAAYHAAQAVLLTEGLNAKTHQGLITLFGLHFVKTGKIAAHYGRLLSNLKDDREEGDYEVVSYIDQEMAVNALKEAQEFVSCIKEYLKKI